MIFSLAFSTSSDMDKPLNPQKNLKPPSKQYRGRRPSSSLEGHRPSENKDRRREPVVAGSSPAGRITLTLQFRGKSYFFISSLSVMISASFSKHCHEFYPTFSDPSPVSIFAPDTQYFGRSRYDNFRVFPYRNFLIAPHTTYAFTFSFFGPFIVFFSAGLHSSSSGLRDKTSEKW